MIILCWNPCSLNWKNPKQKEMVYQWLSKTQVILPGSVKLRECTWEERPKEKRSRSWPRTEASHGVRRMWGRYGQDGINRAGKNLNYTFSKSSSFSYSNFNLSKNNEEHITWTNVWYSHMVATRMCSPASPKFLPEKLWEPPSENPTSFFAKAVLPGAASSERSRVTDQNHLVPGWHDTPLS